MLAVSIVGDCRLSLGGGTRQFQGRFAKDVTRLETP